MDSSKQIRNGVLISYVAVGFNIIAGLLYTPWMIVHLGTSDYGVYGLATSVIALVTLDFGLGQAISRFVAKYIAEKNEVAIQRFLGIALKLYLIIDLAIAIALVIIYCLIENIYVSLSPVEIDRLKVAFVITGAFTLASFPFQILNGVLQAYERFVFQKLMDLVQKVLVVALMVFFLFIGKGLYALVLVNAAINMLIALFRLIYLKKESLFSPRLKSDGEGFDKDMIREIFAFSVWTTIILLLQRLTYNITPTILGITSGTEQISVFNVANVLEGYVFNLTGALGGFFLARVAKLYYGEEKDPERLQQLMIQVGRIQLFVVGAVAAIFFSLGGDFILLWQGEAFRDAYLVAVLLIAPSLITTTQTIADTALVATGMLKYQAITYGADGIIACLIAFILSRRFGAIGAGIGILAGNVLGYIFLSQIWYKRILGIQIGRFFRECHLKMLAPIGICFAVGIFMQIMWNTSGWMYFILKAGMLGILYLLLMWICGFNATEKEKITAFLKRRA